MTDASSDRRAFWNHLWSSDENRPFWTRVDPEVAKLVATTSPQDRPDVLDSGCGLGRNAIAFSQAGYRVTAVDLSEKAVGYVQMRAAELGLTISTQLGHFTDDAFDRETFDVVLAVNVIYHGLPDDFARAVALVHNWLRPRGLFYFTCPTLEDGDYGTGTNVAPLSPQL